MAQAQNHFQPNKTILIELINFGGDGPAMAEREAEILSPFTLYDDGQLIYTRNSQMFEAWLSRAEMTKFENQLATTGVFSVAGDGSKYNSDPIYKNIPPDKLSMGEGDLQIFVSTSKHYANINIYAPWRKYLVPPVAKALNFLSTYTTPRAHVYKPKRTLLYISLNESPSGKAQIWPAQLPKMSELMLNMSVSANDEPLAVFAILENEHQALLAKLITKWGFAQDFTEDNKTYTVIARPLMPHEEDGDFLANTGVYKNMTTPYGGGCEARVMELSAKQAVMQLSCNRGAPTYNMGFREDLIEISGENKAQINTDDCKVNIRFWGDALTLDHLDGNCGFGHGVYPQGNLKLLSKSVTGFWNASRN